MRPHLTAYSAACLIIAWEEQHGRPPNTKECKGSYGLPHCTTLYKFYPDASTFSAVMQRLKHDYIQGRLADGAKDFSCMQCGKALKKSKRKDIRHCSICRHRLFSVTEVVFGSDDSPVLRHFVRHTIFIDDDIDWG